MDRILVFDICSIFVLIVLLFSFHFHRMEKGQSNFTFRLLVLFVLVSAFADITRVSITRYAPHTTIWQNWFKVASYIYFLSRNLTNPVFVLFIYAISGMWHKFKSNKLVRAVWDFFVIAITLIILIGAITNTLFKVSADLEFSRGPLMMELYIVNGLCFLYTLICIILNKNALEGRRFNLLISVITISILGVVIQLFFPKFAVEIMCTTFPLFFIFLLIQRPEENIDYIANCLNYFAFVNDLKQHEKVHNHITIGFIRIVNNKVFEKQCSDQAVQDLLSTISKTLYSFKTNNETEIYYLNSYTFGIMTTTEDENVINVFAQKCCDYLNEKKTVEKSDFLLTTKLYLLKCPEDLLSSKEVLTFLNTFADCITTTNKVIRYSDESHSKEFRIKRELNDIISRAIEKNNLQMHYQPILNVQTGKFESAEALIRLFDENYGFVSPGLFIPAAEQSGAIHEIGDFVLKEVFRFISETDFEAIGLKYIELNLSVAQCIEISLVPKINKMLAEAGIKKDQLNLEVTETAEDFDSEIFYKNIKSLANQGYDFSLDDFGTGYSNVERIINLPVSIIKLDKSFADEYENQNMEVIIKDTICMIKKINRHTLIEGIENEDQYNKFKEWGINYIQGYYFSKPLPEDKFVEFIKKNNTGAGEQDE